MRHGKHSTKNIMLSFTENGQALTAGPLAASPLLAAGPP